MSEYSPKNAVFVEDIDFKFNVWKNENSVGNVVRRNSR